MAQAADRQGGSSADSTGASRPPIPAPGGVVTLALDAAGGVVWACDELPEAMGLEQGRLEGMPVLALLQALGLDEAELARWAQGLAAGEAFTLLPARRGRGREVRIACSARLGSTGPAVERVVGIGLAEGEALKEADLYRRAMEGTSDAVWEMDLNGLVSRWGPGLRRLLRVPEGEQDLGVGAWLARIPKESADRLLELGRLYQEGAIDRHMEEYPIRCFDGTVRWVLDRGCVLERDAQGTASKVVGVVTDIDRMKRAEEGLAHTRELMSTVFKEFGAAVMLEDERHRIVLVNESFCALSGFQREELEGGLTYELLGTDRAALPVADPVAFRTMVATRLAAGVPSQGDRLFLKDGRVMELEYTPMVTSGGAGGHLWVYRDVTERHRLVEELRISGELLNTVIGSMDTALLLEDGRRRMLLINEVFRTMFGISAPPEALKGMDCAMAARGAAELMSDPQAFLAGIQEALSSGERGGPVELHLVDGRVLERAHVPVPLGPGEQGHLWAYRDVTERHRLEREKREVVERNERLLAAVAQATAALVRNGPVLEAMHEGLEAVGHATGVDRVYLFQNRWDASGQVLSTSQRFEWNSGSAEPQIDNPDLWDTPVELFSDILQTMEEGLPWSAHVAELKEGGLRSVLEPQGILSILILPITVRGRFWGFIGFDQCSHLREWASNERSILRSLCASVASALERELLLAQRARDLAAEQAANRFTQRTMGLTDERAVFAAIARELGAAGELEEVSVHVAGEVAGGLVRVVPDPAGDDASAPTMRPLDPGIAAEVLRDRAPRWMRDHGGGRGAGGMLLVPVVCEGDAVAIIACRPREVPHGALEYPGLPGKLADLAAMKLLQLRSFRAAREQDARYRRIIASMKLGLIEVDAGQRITYVNDTLCSMSGHGREELLGMPAFEVEGLRSSMETLARRSAAARGDTSDAFEIGVTVRSGEERHWFISGAPQLDADGRTIGSVSVVLDITDRLRMERELLEANRKAGEALRAKELFLANMSHEMRTPMNAIVGLCNEVLREVSDPSQRARLGAVITAGDNLMRLMNDLLDASRAAVGMLALESSAIDVAACLRQVEMVMWPLALRKGLELRCSMDEALAPRLLGDARRLDQVLLNLVGNALKFTDRGSVDLGVRVLEQVPDGQRLRFTVSDTGVGIDPDFMPHLFEPFNRDPTQAGMAVEGAGLGLTITRDLVGLMGGTIACESRPGKGTTMVVELTLRHASAEPEGARRPAPGPPAMPPSGARVLVVEDSALNRMVVRSMLGGLDVVLHEAANGVEAMVRLCTDDLDVVLLDLRMPVMDGHAFLRALRKDLRCAVPVVALTAGDDPEEELLAAGVDAVLRKPLDRDALFSNLAAHVPRPGAPGCWTHDRVPEGPRMDTSMVRDMVGGDEALYHEVIGAFLKDVPETTAALCEALERGDLPRIAEVAHRVRPSVRMLGMEGAQAAVDDLAALHRNARPLAYVATAVTLLVRELRAVANGLRTAIGEQ